MKRYQYLIFVIIFAALAMACTSLKIYGPNGEPVAKYHRSGQKVGFSVVKTSDSLTVNYNAAPDENLVRAGHGLKDKIIDRAAQMALSGGL